MNKFFIRMNVVTINLWQEPTFIECTLIVSNWETKYCVVWIKLNGIKGHIFLTIYGLYLSFSDVCSEMKEIQVFLVLLKIRAFFAICLLIFTLNLSSGLQSASPESRWPLIRHLAYIYRALITGWKENCLLV